MDYGIYEDPIVCMVRSGGLALRLFISAAISGEQDFMDF